MAQPEYIPIIKLMLIGDSSVGKSCLMYRFVDDTFSTSFMATVGIDFKTKQANLEGKMVKIQVWDTAGQEQFHTVTRSYYRGAMGILLVYDVTNLNSFENISKWLKSIEEYSNNDAFVMIVGNKIDLLKQRVVSTQMGSELLEQLPSKNKGRFMFCETSACTSENVQDAFFQLTKVIMNNRNLERQNERPRIEAPSRSYSSGCCN